MPDALTIPNSLLAIDLGMLDPSAGHSYRRLGELLWSIRSETVLAYVDGTGYGSLPAPDYLIDAAAGRITRAPAGAPVDGWPPEDDATIDITAAVEHIAAQLLISPSNVVIVIGAGRSPTPGSSVLVVVGDGDGVDADAGLHLEDADEDRLIAALHEVGLLGRRAVAAGNITDTAFERAVEVVHRNVTDLGFTAATPGRNLLGAHDANYAAVWARDGVITGLWTLCLDDERLTACFERTLRVLAEHQTPTGQIPTNIQLESGTPEYSGIGGIAGIDSVLWWVIGVARLSMHTGNRALAEDLLEPVERAMAWLAAHDSNNNGLIEMPESSDWMDLFPRSYNVLYDEVLWYEANLHTAGLLESVGRDGSRWGEGAERARTQIVERFWPTGDLLLEIAGGTTGQFSVGEAHYMLSQITPFDYGWRCDVYANLLAALSGLIDERRADRLFTFLWGVGVNMPYPVTALYPPIQSGADDWKDYFLVNFLNLPGHYHNGGIWPFIGGLWVRYLVAMGRVELAHRELAGLAEACRQGIDEEWEFNEWLHGVTGRPMGKAEQAWSAASYVHAYLTLHGDAPAETFPPLKVGF
jgi:glycogen debranching enzyme